MKRKKNKKLLGLHLLWAYLCSFTFILFTLLNLPSHDAILTDSSLEKNTTQPQTKVVNNYLPTPSLPSIERTLPIDNTRRLYLGRKEPDLLLGALNGNSLERVGVQRKLHNEKNIYGDRPSLDNSYRSNGILRSSSNRVHSPVKSSSKDLKSIDSDVDFGLLDRRFRNSKDLDPSNFSVSKDDDSGLDLSSLSIVTDDELELGDIDPSLRIGKKGYGVGKGGQLYAYNFPTKGVGAGIGSSSIGAGAGSGAGLSAGIGEGILNGEIVPTLGGVGDGSKNSYGEPAGAAGVGGLLGGAGAGGAAGLTQGYVTPKLGSGIGSGIGGGEIGVNGRYAHLPKNGSLHIMMHVDGSGSIINTRKQLDKMKDTLLKKALLPYYNNDEGLYNRRVTIVDGSGERTLKFFTQASKKDDVLAVVFQDEAQPAYHLPNFNKKPADEYLTDLRLLKSSLSNHRGIYRGILFQVDRGKTFARSFKEFVGHAFHGTGYLQESNLRKYHRENNSVNIKNKSGIVFNEEYHAKDEGDPQYYLDLLFKASSKVGLDLNIYGAGLTDGSSKD